MTSRGSFQRPSLTFARSMSNISARQTISSFCSDRPTLENNSSKTWFINSCRATQAEHPVMFTRDSESQIRLGQNRNLGREYSSRTEGLSERCCHGWFSS